MCASLPAARPPAASPDISEQAQAHPDEAAGIRFLQEAPDAYPPDAEAGEHRRLVVGARLAQPTVERQPRLAAEPLVAGREVPIAAVQRIQLGDQRALPHQRAVVPLRRPFVCRDERILAPVSCFAARSSTSKLSDLRAASWVIAISVSLR